jgi:DNA-binding MarR family transcriptional regulator/ribosomal protein S18 acetylase RimI-like enzyme
MADHLASLGTLGFTYRIRRLADRISDAGRRFYVALDVPLEPNWHALLLYVDRMGTTSVTEAAAALRVSHPAVIEMTRRMEAKGLITTSPDASDGRRRVLALSEQGRERLPEFKRLWAIIGDELEDVIDATSGSDALSSLSTIEAMFDEQELDVRVMRRLEREQVSDRPAREPTPVGIRPSTERDRHAVLHIARELVRTADTYAYDPAISDDALWRYWSPLAPGAGYVAELESSVVGMFVIRPNIPGPGSHVANASYAVRADVRGIGLGRQMGEASLGLATERGYNAMQFNTVVASNAGAVHLWRSLGFRIVGTIPDGFRLPDGTTVAHHVMHRALP